MTNKKDYFEDFLDDEPLEEVQLNINDIRKNITQYSSLKLCEMIVCDRYLGFDKEITVFCMEELARRRNNGDNFKFEEYIENSKKELPVLDFSMPDLRTVLNQAIGKKKY